MSKHRPEQSHHGHGAEPLTIKPTVSGGGELAILPGEETAEGVEPGPFGIKVMRIAGSGATNAGPVRPALDGTASQHAVLHDSGSWDGRGRGATSAPLAAGACRAECWSGGFDGAEQGERGVQVAGVVGGGGGHGAGPLAPDQGVVARSALGQADGHPAGVVRAGVTLDEALALEPAQGHSRVA